jgi:DNA-binding transcriptional ArsR family regulator
MADDNDQVTPTTDELRPIFRAHAELCKALANEHRQAILHTLCDRELCVSDIAATIGISVHNVSQHLRILKERRLVAPRKEGQTVYYSVTNQKFMQACSLIRQALVEEHLAAGETFSAAELLDAAVPQPASAARAATDQRTGLQASA